MSIATEITRLNNAKASIKSAIEAKGVEVPQDAKIDIYADYIAQIPQGGGEYEPICFTSLEDGNTFQLNKEISISVDGKQTWQTLTANTNSPVINTGEKIYFRATENASPFSGTTSNYYKFSTEKTCNVSGHPYSLYAKGSFYFFANLFNGTKIVDASGLTLEDVVSTFCYYNMFNGCTSLVTAPELPATTLAERCYEGMFNGCTSLVTAPELPATTLISGCYTEMFRGCSSLNYIKALFTTEPSSSYTSNWVLGVAATGTFVKSTEATWTTIGVNGVPEGWTVKVEWEKQYLTFIPVVDATFKWIQPKATGHLEYSTDGGQTWTTLADRGSTSTITAGSKVLWRGDLVPSSLSGWEGTGTFSASGNYNAYGNTMSLLFYDNYYDKQLNSTKYNYAFRRLFMDDTHILSAPLLPATSLSYSCYWQMFRGCTSLVTTPELPATTLANGCYYQMFQECTKLTSVPELPATTLADSCYLGMFNGCTSLTTAPELPATTLEANCYQSMFQGTSLTTAPELPATTLANSCYNAMFRDCANLVTAPELPATTLASMCYHQMFINCSSLVTAPALPATTLITRCYYYMFYNCSSLNYVKCLATDISAANCTNSWVTNVASTGTFVKNPNMSSWPTGNSGIPTGWTVVNDNA